VMAAVGASRMLSECGTVALHPTTADVIKEVEVTRDVVASENGSKISATQTNGTHSRDSCVTMELSTEMEYSSFVDICMQTCVDPVLNATFGMVLGHSCVCKPMYH